MRALLERVVLTAGRRPGRVLLAVALVAGISAVLALRLEPSTAVETLVGKSSDSYRATEVYRQKFGDHAIVVLARGDLANLVLTDNLGRLLGLEAKMAQYRDGARFVRAVVDKVGMDEFNAVWAEPANLPSKTELSDHDGWIRRVLN